MWPHCGTQTPHIKDQLKLDIHQEYETPNMKLYYSQCVKAIIVPQRHIQNITRWENFSDMFPGSGLWTFIQEYLLLNLSARGLWQHGIMCNLCQAWFCVCVYVLERVWKKSVTEIAFICMTFLFRGTVRDHSQCWQRYFSHALQRWGLLSKCLLTRRRLHRPPAEPAGGPECPFAD